jgi:hypothetical protein
MNEHDLLIEFCRWFMRTQRRNTRQWKTTEERDALECPNQQDVEVFFSSVRRDAGDVGTRLVANRVCGVKDNGT